MNKELNPLTPYAAGCFKAKYINNAQRMLNCIPIKSKRDAVQFLSVFCLFLWLQRIVIIIRVHWVIVSAMVVQVRGSSRVLVIQIWRIT